MKLVQFPFVVSSVLLALLGAPVAEALVCQPTGDGVTEGDAISQQNQSSQLDFTFCQGDPGVDFCFIGTQGTLVDLELSGRADVDITCEFSIPNGADGRICIADGNCEESEFVSRPGGDDTKIRLMGDLLPSENYKIAVFDLTGANANICPGPSDGGNIETVTCTGVWGNPPPCYQLTTEHTPDEGGDDPTTTPNSSDECPNGQYIEGETVQLRAQPATGWKVRDWSGTNNNSTQGVLNSVTMPGADHTVGVTYEQDCNRLRLLRTPSSGGAAPTADPTQSAACSEAGEYLAGETIEVTAAPAEGWEIERWKGTDNDSSTSATNTATMPAEAHDVLVVYTLPIVGFDSGFETEGFCDWSSRRCNGCEEFSCDLAAGETSIPINSYRTFEPGEHRGTLRGPEDTDFDLVLEWWTGSLWVPVASQLSPWSSEEVVHQGEPGFYRWRVTSAEGSGTYDLEISYPGLKKAGPNHLERARKPKKEGKRSLKAVFDKKSKHFDYLIDTRAGIGPPEPAYEASFYLRADNGLFVKGKKHQIFQLQQVQGVSKAKPLVEIFLQGKRGNYSVAARVDTGDRPEKGDRVPFAGGEWTLIRIVWSAASSAGANDGRLELWVGGELGWSKDLDNSSQAVDRAFLGQVTKGSKKTNGDLYFDDFKSSWEN